MATTQEITFRDAPSRIAAADAKQASWRRRSPGETRRHAGREDGPQHGAVASVHARRVAHRAGTGWRDHHEGDSGRRLSASRRRENRREHDLHPVHPLHGSAGLSRAAREQRRLRARGREVDGHRHEAPAALPIHPRDLLRTGAHLGASARARALSRWMSAR